MNFVHRKNRRSWQTKSRFYYYYYYANLLVYIAVFSGETKKKSVADELLNEEYLGSQQPVGCAGALPTQWK